MALKALVKAITPPVFLGLFRTQARYGFFGNYSTWQEAQSDSVGYDNPYILEKVKDALLKVKSGQAVYERDSVLFSEVEYSWPILAGLLWIASRDGNKLNLIDFGGSLGSSYFQNRAFLEHLQVRWNIVEQKNFVECGKRYFEDERLRFFETIDACLVQTHPTALLLSSVVQYLEKPYEFLEGLLAYDFEYLFFDRTFFLEHADRLTVQKVPPRIYAASYPAWFLDKERCLSILNKAYTVVATFPSLGGTIDLNGTAAFEEGFILKKKS